MRTQPSHRLALRLAAGFTLVILIGLIGYVLAVKTLRETAQEARRNVTLMQSSLTSAKDALRASRDISFNTFAYVQTGEQSYWEDKWLADDQSRAALSSWRASLQRLPDAQAMLSQRDAIEREVRTECEPMETQMFALSHSGLRPKALEIYTSQYISARSRYEIKVGQLIEAQQQYWQDQQRAQARAEQQAVNAGSIGQIIAVALSILIAYLSASALSGGMRQVLAAEAEQRAQAALVENSGDFIAIVDLEMQVVYLNRAGRRLVGLSADREAPNLPSLVAEEDDAFQMGAIHDAILERGRWQGELRLRHIQTGRLTPTDATAFSLDGSGSAAPRLALVCRDLSDRRAMEAERERLTAESVRRADHDTLTGLLTHRAFLKRYEQEAERAVAQQTALTLVLLDIDRFKAFNESYGHAAGDEILNRVAQTLEMTVSGAAFVSRYGGDEFALLLRGDVVRTLPSLLAAPLSALVYRTEDGESVPITLSAGTAVFPEDSPQRLDLLDTLEARLARAQREAARQTNPLS